MSVSASAVTLIVVIGVNGMNYIFLVSLALQARSACCTTQWLRDDLS